MAFEQGIDEEMEPMGKDLREEHFCQKKECMQRSCGRNGLGDSRSGVIKGEGQ